MVPAAITRLRRDRRILWQLVRGAPRGSDHGDRLTRFYGDQATDYDHFRARLLPGRRDLFAALGLADGARFVELGAGTGSNLGYLGPRLSQLERVDLVDLCPPLLDQARRRWEHHPNVRIHTADACTWQPDQAVDAVVFSYALTMIPDWRGALANACAMLRPGGRLGVVDFTVLPGQNPLARRFWSTWFRHDGVFLDADHTATLCALLPPQRLELRRTNLPYLPGLRVPYYLYIGTRGFL